MDPLFEGLSLFRRRKFEAAVDLCTKILSTNPYDQAAWTLKLRCLSEQLYFDEVENDDDNIAEDVLDENYVAENPTKPGTSLRQLTASVQSGKATSRPDSGQTYRPRTQAGRPLSGVIRPGTNRARPGTVERAIRTPRTSSAARPSTSAAGRFLRLGTASMLSSAGGPFVNISRLNFEKYAAQPYLSKQLFEYMFYYENDLRNALQFATVAARMSKEKDWFWKVQQGKCYFRFGLYRHAEKHILCALSLQPVVETYLLLGKIYLKFDQPSKAISVYKQGLEIFHSSIRLLTALARVHEDLRDLNESASFYKEILKMNSISVEAIACLAAHHFYNDAPELSLRLYRRLLQIGVYNAEIFTNMGLCCFYAQQFDLAVICLLRAVQISNTENQSAVWYNIGHVALASGDSEMAYECFRLSQALDPQNSDACCNLAVLEMRLENHKSARSLLITAMSLGDQSFEPFFNFALLCYEAGDYSSCWTSISKSLEIFPDHSDSKFIKKKVAKILNRI